MFIPLEFDGNTVVQSITKVHVAILRDVIDNEHSLVVACRQYIGSDENTIATIIMKSDSELDGYYTAERSTVMIQQVNPQISFEVRKIENIRIYTKELLKVFGRTPVDELKIDVITAEYTIMSRVYDSIMSKASIDLKCMISHLP